MNMFKKGRIMGNNDQRRQDKAAANAQKQQQQAPRGGGPQQQLHPHPPSSSNSRVQQQQQQPHQSREYIGQPPEYSSTAVPSTGGIHSDTALHKNKNLPQAPAMVDGLDVNNNNNNSRNSSDISSLEERHHLPPALPKHHSNPSQTSLGAPSNTSINGSSTFTNNNNNSSGNVDNLNTNSNSNNTGSSNNNNNKSGSGGSNSSNKSKDKVVSKTEFYKGQVDKLTEGKRKLEQENELLKIRLEDQRKELQGRYEDSQRLLRFKEEEFVKMQNNFHKHVRAIRATDDDLSTIHSKLTMLQAKTGQLPMSLRGSYNETKLDSILDYFKKKWPSLSQTLDTLTHQGQKMDYPLVCLLVEKLVMEILIDDIFNAPIHIGLTLNNHYKHLSDLMKEQRYHDWSTKLRQQLCKLTLQSKELQQEANLAKQQIVQRLKTEIQPIYTIEDAKIIPKLEKIVNMAAETSLAMHGQEEPVIFGQDLIEGKTMFDPQYMTLQYGSTIATPSNNDDDMDIDNKELEQKESNNSKSNDSDKESKKKRNEGNQENKKDDDYEDGEDDDDDDDDNYNDGTQHATSSIPTPSLLLRVIISPVVYGGDGNGNLTPLLCARVICT
ncbi:hypothetical protein BJ944DRAFT_242753 [Cunninghamella echinulata]|nr:hypothetical protein BJ944DRAFT_242753 [Cunninghamella echinulata]